MARQVLVPYVHTDGVVWEFFFEDPKSRVIYFSKKHNGKRIKFSTKEKAPNGIKAKRFANAEFDRRIGKTTAHVRNLIVDELKAFLRFKETEGWKYDTLNNIRRAVRQIEPFWGDKLPNEIDRDSFAKWVEWWKENNTEIEMENAVKYFNNFCVYLHEKVVNNRPLLPSRLRFKDPNRKVIKARRARKKERIFTADEFRRVHATAANEDEALVVHIMYTMATRIDETLKLNFSDRILLDREMPVYRWTVDNNKAEKIGRHALHPSLIEPLRRLRERRKSEGTQLLFPQKFDNLKALSSQQIDWAAWRDRANLGWHWTAHTFKHTILTNLFNDPRNPQLVICELYRTSLQVALEVYVKMTEDSIVMMRDRIEVKL